MKTTNELKIVFKNRIQKVLFDCELCGQISDGKWENSSPRRHYVDITSAETFFDADESKQGTYGFSPKRSYNFADKELFDIVGERMINYVKVSILFPEINNPEVIRLIEYFNEESSFEEMQYQASHPDMRYAVYYKDTLEIAKKEFGFQNKEEYLNFLRRFNCTEIVQVTPKQIRKELKEMSQIIKIRKG